MNYFIQIGGWLSFFLLFIGTFLSFFNHNSEGADIASKVVLIIGIFGGLWTIIFYVKNKKKENDQNNQQLRYIENIFRKPVNIFGRSKNIQPIEPVV